MPAERAILQVLPALDTGGVERGTIEVAEAVVRAGGRAIVASAGGRLVPALERVGGRHVTLPLLTKDPLNLWINAGRLARLARAQGVSLIHARSRAPAWSALGAARRTGVPFVTTWHGVYAENLPGKRFYNGVMARGDRVIAISEFVARRIEEVAGLGAPLVRVIPRGVDPAVFDPARVSGERIHRLAQAWRLPPGAPVVMLPARLTRWKGGTLLLRAVASRPALRDAFLVLVGDAQGRRRYPRALEGLAERLGIGARLRLAGACEDMPAALMLADVVVVPSEAPEPFGRSVIEAQAMGRRVIGADHGAIPETIEAGVTGWRVPPGDVTGWGEAIDAALRLNPETSATMGLAARAAVLARYTTARMQAATLELYEEVLT